MALYYVYATLHCITDCKIENGSVLFFFLFVENQFRLRSRMDFKTRAIIKQRLTNGLRVLSESAH